MMRLICNGGRRVDRQAELEQLIHRARITPYELVTPRERQQLKTLLDLRHRERETVRFSARAGIQGDYET